MSLLVQRRVIPRAGPVGGKGDRDPPPWLAPGRAGGHFCMGARGPLMRETTMTRRTQNALAWVARALRCRTIPLTEAPAGSVWRLSTGLAGIPTGAALVVLGHDANATVLRVKGEEITVSAPEAALVTLCRV